MILYNNMVETNKKIIVSGTKISVVSKDGQDYLSLTEMLKAKDGFFIADWLRNQEYSGVYWDMGEYKQPQF